MNSRHAVRLIVAVLSIVVLAALFCGCGRVRKAASTTKEVARVAQDAKDGEVTIKGEDGEEVTLKTDEDDEVVSWQVQGEDGETTTAEFGSDKVSEEDVGLKFYPGAEAEGSGTIQTTGGEEGGSFCSVSLRTGDSFDKVAKFYKDEYAKGNTVMEQPGQLMILIDAGEDSGKTVIVSRDEGSDETAIVLSSGSSM